MDSDSKSLVLCTSLRVDGYFAAHNFHQILFSPLQSHSIIWETLD